MLVAHRIRIGVLCCLPLASRIASLILVDFIRELCVTCIGLSQEAVGERGLLLPRRNGTGTRNPSYFTLLGDPYGLE